MACQLVALQGQTLLLPRRAVREVVAMDSVTLATDGPAWFLGFVQWRGQALPLIALEVLAGAAMPVRARRSRITILNGLGNQLEGGLFAVLSQGFPRFTVLNAAALQPLPAQHGDAGIALSRARLESIETLIPDLEAIEGRIAKALTAIGGVQATQQPWEFGP